MLLRPRQAVQEEADPRRSGAEVGGDAVESPDWPVPPTQGLLCGIRDRLRAAVQLIDGFPHSALRRQRTGAVQPSGGGAWARGRPPDSAGRKRAAVERRAGGRTTKNGRGRSAAIGCARRARRLISSPFAPTSRNKRSGALSNHARSMMHTTSRRALRAGTAEGERRELIEQPAEGFWRGGALGIADLALFAKLHSLRTPLTAPPS